MSYTTSKSLHLSNRDFFVGINSYDSTTVPSNEIKLTDSTGAANDRFGGPIAIGCNRIAISSTLDADDGLGIGSVSIFDFSGNFIAKINADGPNADYFGSDVGIGCGRIVVGTRYDDSVPDQFYNDGSIFIFDLNGNFIKKVFPYDQVDGGEFGSTLAVGSGRIAVSSYDFLFGQLIGSVYIYDLDGNIISKIQASDGAAGDRFGYSLAIGCGRIVVGASSSANSGAVYIFDLDGNQLAKIVSDDIQTFDNFGYSVSVGHGLIAVGAPFEDGPGDSQSNSGSVYIFDLQGNQLAKMRSSDIQANDNFGRSVKISDGRILISASQDTNENGTEAGALYVYDLNRNFITKILASDGAAQDYFGELINAGSGKIVVAARYDDNANGSQAGAAYVYDTPIQKHFLDQLD